MGSIFMNSYVFNLYGILEGMISNVASCSGRGLNHYALDDCEKHPLSIAPVYSQVMKTHRQLDDVVLKTVTYVGIIFRLDEAKHQFIYNSIIAFALGPLTKSQQLLRSLEFGGDAKYVQSIASSMAGGAQNTVYGIAGMMGAFVQASFASIYGIFFIYDEILLKYLQSLIQNEHYSTQNDVGVGVFALSNLVFDSIATGRMKDTLLAPQYRICQTYSQLTGNTKSALATVVFHSCLSIFEVFYAVLQIISSTITLSGVTDCICNINEYDLEQVGVLERRCRYKLPDTLYPELAQYIRMKASSTKGQKSKTDRVSICSTLVNNFRNVLLKIPTKAKIHIDIALKASIDVPIELMNFMQIKGLQADSCTQYQNTLDVITIVPRPLSAFKKCAYVPSCRCVSFVCLLLFSAFCAAVPHPLACACMSTFMVLFHLV